MAKSEDIQDRYTNRHGEWLRVWTICDVSGQAHCVTDASLVADLTAQEVSDQEASNASVRAAIADVEAYEAALKLSAQDEPPATVIEYDDAGDPLEVANPAHAEWVAAGDTVAAVSPETLTLAQKRAGTWVDPTLEGELP
jgi:hypothetical protein